jgi:hypothetical protein
VSTVDLTDGTNREKRERRREAKVSEAKGVREDAQSGGKGKGKLELSFDVQMPMS